MHTSLCTALLLHVCCKLLHIIKIFLKAKEAVEEAAKIDPNNIFTQFNIYKIAVMMNNTEKGNGDEQN